MNVVVIYISDSKLDLFPETILVQTLKSNNIGTLATRNVNYTNNFRIPVTDNNNEIFGYSNLVQSNSSFNYQTKYARVLINGVEVIHNGTLYVKYMGGYYSANIVFGAIGFFNELEGKTLNELDLSAINGFWSLDSTANATTGIVSPVIDYGKYVASDIHDQTYLPSIYYHTVMNAIIADAGYTKSGTIFSDTRYTKHILPYGRSSFAYSDDFYTDRKAAGEATALSLGDVAAGVVITYDSATIQDPFGFFVPATGLYSATESGSSTDDLLYLVKVTVTIDITVTGGGTIDLIAEDSTVATQSALLSNKGTGVYTRASDAADAAIDPYIAALQGRAVRLRAITNTGTANVTVNSIVTTIEPIVGILDTYYINYAKLLPGLSQKDFFKDFAIRFGQLFKEKNGVLYCKSIDEIINDRANAVNWTDKRVRGNEEINPLPNGFCQNNYFNHSYQDYEEGLSEATGQGNLSVSNTNIPLSKEQYKSPLHACLTRVTGGINMAYIPVYVDGQIVRSFSNDPKPRVCLVRDKRASEPNVTFDTAQSSYKVAYFEDESESYQGGFQPGIDQFYYQYQQSIQKYKSVTREYNLTESDIANLDFFVPVFDNDSYYLLDTVGPYIPGRPCEVVMLKIY